MYFRFCLLLIGGWLLLASRSLVAQPIETAPAADSVREKPVRSLSFSYSYMNPVSYRGRTFGVHQFGMMPQLTYQTATNWRVYGAGYIWNNFQESNFGKIDLGVEKEGMLGKHLTYTLGYERWFFPSADPGEQQPLTNFTEAYLTYDWHDWSPAIGTYYMFGSEKLLQTDLQLSRYVGLIERDNWSLFAEPLVKAVFANQNTLVNGIYQPQFDRRGRPLQAVASNTKPFGLVDAEINLPITLQLPRWSLLVDPRIAQPYNTLPGERTKPFFYAVATISYSLQLPTSHGQAR